MHIMEGYLPLAHSAAWYAATAPFVVAGALRLRRIVSERPEARMTLAAATTPRAGPAPSRSAASSVVRLPARCINSRIRSRNPGDDTAISAAASALVPSTL